MNVHVTGTTAASPATARPSQGRPGDGFAVVFAEARAATGTQAAAGTKAAADTSRLRSPLLAPVLLPTRTNVQQLASELARTLSRRFAAAGLPTVPAVGFAVDGEGAIAVSGRRSDLAEIQSLIDGDEALQRAIRDTNAIASHAYEIESGGHLEFQRAYRLSSNPREIVAQYASLLGGRPRAAGLSVGFSGSAVSIAAGGTTWLAA